ncbi:MAG: class I SAM-dependent methyltransferase [Candidatus Kariarchaeaceae archaeon]
MNINSVDLTDFSDEVDFYTCCTNFYESDIVKFLLGDTFHPGGVELTMQLAGTFNLIPGNLIVDIACGVGTSLKQIIKKFEIVGIGIDLSFTNLQRALIQGKIHAVDTQLALIQADSHSLPFRSSSAKSIMSECSFCIFLSKTQVSKEIFRVLKQGGQFGFTDVTKTKDWPHKLNDMVHRVACIADAKSIEEYSKILEIGGLSQIEIVDKKEVVYDLHSSLKKKVLLLNIIWGFKKHAQNLSNISKSDFKIINESIDLIKEFVDYNYGSYVMITAVKH